MIRRIMQIEEGVIRRSRRLRRITPSEICIILHIIRKPNSIIALLFIQNISRALKIYKIFFNRVLSGSRKNRSLLENYE